MPRRIKYRREIYPNTRNNLQLSSYTPELLTAYRIHL
nr:MAG TPA: hypothetical protein [Caudoviricetes sp.]